MSQREQKKFFETLKRYERKFEQKELDDYRMLLSMERLQKLFEKFHLNREKKNYDNFFTKHEDEQ